MDDSNDHVCRICRCGKEVAVLYTPCRCSGSIGQIHEQCLMDWLSARAGREQCEVCKEPYRFSKVYAHNVPNALPISILVKRLVLSLIWITAIMLRALFVTFSWVALLPYATAWIFRGYIWSGSNIADHLSNIFIPHDTSPNTYNVSRELSPNVSASVNNTKSVFAFFQQAGVSVDPVNFNSSLNALNNSSWDRASQLISTMGKDTFTGQIITCIVVISFLAIFLLREWIGTHGLDDAARPVAPPQIIEAVQEAPVVNLQVPIVPAEVVIASHSEEETPAEAFEEAQEIGGSTVTAMRRTRSSPLSSPLYSSQANGRPVRPLKRPKNNSYSEPQSPVLSSVEFSSPERQSSSSVPDLKLNKQIDFNFARQLEIRTDASTSQTPPFNTFDGTFAAPDSDLTKSELTLCWERMALAETALSQVYEYLPVRFEVTTHYQFKNWTVMKGMSRRRYLDQKKTSAHYPTRERMKFLVDEMNRLIEDAQSALGVEEEFGDDSLEATCTELREAFELLRMARITPESRQILERGFKERDAVEESTLILQSAPSSPLMDISMQNEAAALGSQANTELPAEGAQEVIQEDSSFNDDNLVAEDENALPEPVRENDGNAIDDDDGPDDAWIEEEPEDDDANGGIGEANLDDLDGVLEAVGMRGNLLVFFQTVALMILLIGLFLAIGFWAPFIIGRVFISTKASYYIYLGPIRLVRLFTDPLVDMATNTIRRAVKVPPSIARNASERALDVAQLNSTTTVALSLNSSSPYLMLRETFIRIDHSWSQMAVSDRSIDRAFCTVLGYVVSLLAASIWYLRERALDRPWSLKARTLLRQYGVLFKVACFIIIELLAFPFVCGCCLNLSTLPLFPGVQWADRIAYFHRAPYSATFITWTLGTLFMFGVAQWISLCRTTLRKGALFFIRDPKDPDGNPIKDMVESAIVTQVGKLGKSAVLYGALMSAFALAASSTRRFMPQLFPLQWSPASSLTPVPIDLIIAFLVIPPSLRACKPVRTSKRLFKKWTIITAHQLRLSSFLLGKRHPSEEGHWVRRRGLSTYLFRFKPSCSLPSHQPDPHDCDCEKVWVPSGSLARAPASNSIKLVPGRPATIPIDDSGEAKTEEGKRYLELYKSEGYAESDWETIYLPPHFRFRLMLGLYLLWISGSAFVVTLLVLPLLVGRSLSTLLLDTPLHDGYCMLLGAYIVYPIGVSLYRFDKRYRATHMHVKLSTGGRYISRIPKQSIFEHLRVIFNIKKRSSVSRLVRPAISGVSICLTGGIILPLLCGLSMELYIFSPLDPFLDIIPHLWLPQLWAYGVVELAILYGTLLLFPRPGGSLVQACDIKPLQIAQRERGTRFVAYAARIQKNVVLPFIRILLYALALPCLLGAAGASLAHSSGHRLSEFGKVFWYRIAPFQISFLLIARRALYRLWKKASSKYVQAVKDKEFLIERRILNYKDNTPTTTTISSPI